MLLLSLLNVKQHRKCFKAYINLKLRARETIVSKTDTMKEPKKRLVIDFLVGPRSDRWSNW